MLDSEIVAFRESGTPSFSLLQQRMKLSAPAEIARVGKEVPVRFLAFDVLMLNGISLLGKRYTDRRLLEAIGFAGESVRSRGAAGSVAAALDETRRRGLEEYWPSDVTPCIGGQTIARLGQAQAHSGSGSHHRRLAPRKRQARRNHRFTAGRGAR